MLNLCNNCPRCCKIDRSLQKGFCGAGSQLMVARACLHFGEEPCISGVKGSGTIFFSGCSLKCVYCQNCDISHKQYGRIISEDRFIEIIKELEGKGANNINLVTPTHYFSNIESALNRYRPSIPIVYNSSGYESIENINKNLFDIYLFDLKFFSKEKSLKYAGCRDYFEVASNVIKTALNLVGRPVFDENGIMKRGVVVRHLILPSSTNDSIEIIKWLNNNTPDIVFSLMSQYVPMYKASEHKEINRRITKREYNKVLEECYKCDFVETYTQELSSSTKDEIPKFDLTGV